MFRTTATTPASRSPLSSDWTIQQLLDWIAADDARSHDESLRSMLSALAAGIVPGDAPALTPRTPVALVRAVAEKTRTAPALRGRTLGAVPGVAEALPAAEAHRTDRSAAAGQPASVRTVVPQLG